MQEIAGLSRAQFLARAQPGSLALVAGGSVLALAAGPATAQTAPGEEDLAHLRLAAAAELLAEAFYTRAIIARTFVGAERAYLGQARKTEREHYAALAALLGDGAPRAADFQFRFPENAFATRASAARIGVALETAFVGAYLGAVGALQSSELRFVAAQIAASEASHLSVMSGISTGNPIGPAFPSGLDLEQASSVLDRFLGE